MLDSLPVKEDTGTQLVFGLAGIFSSAAPLGGSKGARKFSRKLRENREGEMEDQSARGAKSLVTKLAEDIGFSVIDVGDLSKAVLLEYLAGLWIHLAFGQKMGTNIGFKLLNR